MFAFQLSILMRISRFQDGNKSKHGQNKDESRRRILLALSHVKTGDMFTSFKPETFGQQPEDCRSRTLRTGSTALQCCIPVPVLLAYERNRSDRSESEHNLFDKLVACCLHECCYHINPRINPTVDRLICQGSRS